MCGRCRTTPPPCRLLAVWRYETPLADALRALKYRRLDFLGAAIAHRLVDQLGPWPWFPLEREDPPRYLTAVPLHWSRRWVRGYDQVALIAEPCRMAWGLEPARLVRTRRTGAQTRLPLARRRRNLSAAFAVRARDSAGLDGQHVLLIDDVVTTGSTLHAAARALLRAGARRVTALAVARTPERGEWGGH